MGLNEVEYEIVSYIEQEYLLTSHVPSQDVIVDRVAVPEKLVKNLFKRDDFKNALLARGINIEPKTSNALTPKQMLAINTMLDLNDNRSDKKKLADIGVPTATWQGWQRDPSFQMYWNQRTEALFGDALSEANRALYDNVKKGDLGSMKQLWEMTGRWSSKPVSEMNIEWILMKVIETIQKHVTDPVALENIASDLGAIQQEAVPTVKTFAPLKAVEAPINEPIEREAFVL